MRLLSRFALPNLKFDTETERQFRAETLKSARGSMRFVCVIAGILYPVFGILDIISFPDIYQELILIRCIVVPFVFLTLILTFVPALHDYMDYMGVFLFQILGAGITVMTLLTGGKVSPYYAGLNLVLLTQIVSMPWPMRLNVVSTGLVWATYTVLVIAVDFYRDANDSDANWRLFIGNNFFLIGTILIGCVWSAISFRLRKVLFQSAIQLASEKEKSEQLLRNTLPEFVIEELKEHGTVKPRRLECTVLFTDFVGFTRISENMSPEDVLLELDRSFEYFDSLCEKYGMDKIKTIGDSYMCASGVAKPGTDHAVAAALMAIEIRSYMNMMAQIKSAVGEDYWQLRIGIHSGPVVGGIVGKHRYAYDIWGDTVNTASRMESSGEAGEINLSDYTNVLVSPYFITRSRGLVAAKGKGELEMHILEGIRPDYADDEAGRTPNERLLSLIDRG